MLLHSRLESGSQGEGIPQDQEYHKKDIARAFLVAAYHI